MHLATVDAQAVSIHPQANIGSPVFLVLALPSLAAWRSAETYARMTVMDLPNPQLGDAFARRSNSPWPG